MNIIMNKEIMNKIVTTRFEHYEQQKKDEIEEDLFNKRWLRDIENKTKMLKSCREATREEYEAFVIAHLSVDINQISRCCDHLFEQINMYIAEKDISIYPLCGMLSIRLIIPEDIKAVLINGDENSHNILYWMNTSHKSDDVELFYNNFQ